MPKKPFSLCLAVVVFALSACGESNFAVDNPVIKTSFAWQVREDLPLPVEPVDNPITEEKFDLGRHLFYDIRLSGNGTQACGSCHQQDKAFTDGLMVPTGSTGDILLRNSQTLTNVAYNATLTWANPALVTLEAQLQVPLFAEHPVEQGLNESNQDAVLQRIRDEPRYADLFAKAFPNQGNSVTYENIALALASFVRGLTSFASPFDRYAQGDKNALSASALRGETLFFSERLECFHCHGGYNFSDSTVDRSLFFVERPFHNTGLYNVDGQGAYPADNQGLIAATLDPSDMGKFRAPTLRNIALTAPYMHDGSIQTLEEVIDFYGAGGRNITSGPHAGDGRANPFKDSFVKGFSLNPQEKADLIAFLNSLSDTEFTTTPRFSNPWTKP